MSFTYFQLHVHYEKKIIQFISKLMVLVLVLKNFLFSQVIC